MLEKNETIDHWISSNGFGVGVLGRSPSIMRIFTIVDQLTKHEITVPYEQATEKMVMFGEYTGPDAIQQVTAKLWELISHIEDNRLAATIAEAEQARASGLSFEDYTAKSGPLKTLLVKIAGITSYDDYVDKVRQGAAIAKEKEREALYCEPHYSEAKQRWIDYLATLVKH